ncbi:MAG: ankyrin repeat domain-containing protein [Bacteroidota bacterium]
MNPSAAFFEAIQAGNLPEVQALLSAQPGLALEKSPQGLSPLMLSLYHRQAEMVAILLAQGVPLDWYEAAAVGAVARLEALLEERTERLDQTAPDGFSALGLACFFGQQASFDFLLVKGADVNQASQNSFQVRPIHSAVAAGNLSITLALLQAGADPNAAQMQGVRPLHSAAHQGNLDMVELLLNHGADPALTTDDGKTALDYARADGHTSVIARLEK